MSKKREELLKELEEENRRSTTEGLLLLQAIAQRSGMNLTDLQCINILSSTGPITAGRLAEEMGLTTGAVTGVINRLERAGYVRREKDADDGRRVVIRSVAEELERTGAGLFGSREKKVLDELFSGYDDRDLAVFLGFMRKANALTREEIGRVRDVSGGEAGGEFSASLGSVRNGRLVFVGGASRLTLRVAAGMGDLYRARFGGNPPKAEVQDGTVTFRRPRRFTIFDLRRHAEEVTLNAAVPWAVEVRGGAAWTTADLSGLKLTSFVLAGGTTDLVLTLPEPSGVVPVRLSGGASKVSIRRPYGVEARISLEGGAGKLSFDKQSFDAVGGNVRLQSPGYDGASDRYEIEVSGGANEISVK